METITLQMILLAFLGMIIHMGMKVNQRSNKQTNKFSLKTWMGDRMNWWRLIITVASTAALLLMVEDIAAWFGVSVAGHGNLMNVCAFAAGYLNHSLIRNILKIFKKQVNTNANNEG